MIASRLAIIAFQFAHENYACWKMLVILIVFLLAAFHMYLDPKGAPILCKRLIIIYV